MSEKFLAIDIGASGGRHIIGYLEDGRLITKEIYRFPNGFHKSGSGHLCWDLDALFSQILIGLKKCREMGMTPAHIGIDTWGVDFVLTDADLRPIGESVAYRDHRTEGMDAVAEKIISAEELYARTGIQKQTFNTVYQLLAIKEQSPELLASADRLMFIPDYLHFLLTGIPSCEYTEASTSGLLNARKRDWDLDLIERLGFPKRIFRPVTPAGTRLGPIKEEIANIIGYSADVILPASHDTGSAVLAVPNTCGDALYISSGTWSLMGVERSEPDTRESSRQLNFTNEGGYGGSYRYLKNIMGLWILQSLKRETGYTFDQIMNLAEANLDTKLRIDVDLPVFLAPENMEQAIRQSLPDGKISEGELFAVVYLSLADSYARTAAQIEAQTGKTYSALHIIGGGSQDALLNRLSRKACGTDVLTGPTEATAIGNLLSQMIGRSELDTVPSARACVMKSFPIRKVEA
ncbi:MAG: rhamnulokinase family protein [Eubacteriales bacterium]